MKLRNWTKSRGAVAAFAIFLSADLAAGVGAASLAVAATTAPESGQLARAVSSSATTVAWDNADRVITDPNYDLFKDLELTVSQTENLSNQGIDVTWSGGVTTSSGEYATNYLQIMQCWGNSSGGPTPQQCQWGAPASNLGSLMGSNTGTRNLVESEDPQQLYDGEFKIPPPRSNPNQRAFSVPFTSVKGSSTFNSDIYFSTSSTNEVTAARTGEDGTGQVVFETQTSLEAPHLGCGAPVDGGAGRSCWLVAVPRGAFNADGTPSTVDASGRIVGSPLSASNWANRIQVALDFAPVGANCPIGNAERRTAGTELVADAFTSWQSALCGTGTTFGYSLIGDQEARSQLVSGLEGAAGLAFVNEPLSADTVSGSTIEYAPVVTSGVVIAFNIERNLTSNSPNFSRNGTPVTSLTLNQRLVAKLLTQSYRSDVPNGNNQPHVAGNPRSIRNDPEFLALNPEFSDFASSAAPDGLMVSLGSSDATAQVWRWIKGDADAREFLDGTADEWGMKVNPAYKDLKITEDAGVDSFPKADLSTYRQFSSIPEPGFGTLDLRPYVLDMHEGASRARRADANVKIVWDDTKNPPAFVSSGPQLPGTRFSMAIIDSASAARYGLPTAKLVNAAGKAVAADSAGLQAGVGAMVTSGTKGVVVVDPDKRVSGAYPLTMVTYAAINVCSTPLAGLKDYAKLLTYSAGDGQVTGDSDGQLPVGYLPLGADFTKQSAAAVKAIKSEVSKPKCVEHQKVEPVPPAEEPEEYVEAPVEEIPPTVEAAPTIVPAAFVEETPSSSGGATRFAFLAALFFGVPCLTVGPILLRRS